MTIQEFQIKNGEWLKAVLADQKGQELMAALSVMCPGSTESPHVHLYADSTGQAKGYQKCLRNMLYLTQPPKPQNAPDMNYGVIEQTQETTKK